MRKILHIQIVLFMMVAGLSSCSDYLDKDPMTDTSIYYEEVFSDPKLARGFLNNIYNSLQEGFDPFGDGSMLDAATDDAVCSNASAQVHLFNSGGISPSYNPDDVWEHYYTAIRKCNIFLKELDGIIAETNSIPASERDVCRGEAIFLRAFFHFELLKRYQRIFWVDQVYDAFDTDAVFKTPQREFQEVATLIAEDCDSAYTLLPKEKYNTDAALKGHPIAAAPKALKSRVLLYAASPLNNPGGDMELWKKAEEAAKDFLDEFKSKFPKQSYVGFFNKVDNKEIIFATGARSTNTFEQYNFPLSYGGKGMMNPTQDLVDCYAMRGSSNLDELVGSPANINTYNPDAPYAARRDLRFEAIVYDSLEYKVDSYVETFVGGKDGLGSSNNATKTGYYLQKYVTRSLDLSKGETQMHQWIYFRTSEIMLNYAEALCMRLGADASVVSAIKEFRSLAGLAAFKGIDDYTPEELLDYIKKERRVELAFEGHRFWDLRRWKDAERVLNQPVHGMKITRTQVGTDENQNPVYKKNYEIIEVENRSFDPKMYWYPIPRAEILKYRNAGIELKQNPGY